MSKNGYDSAVSHLKLRGDRLRGFNYTRGVWLSGANYITHAAWLSSINDFFILKISRNIFRALNMNPGSK